MFLDEIFKEKLAFNFITPPQPQERARFTRFGKVYTPEKSRCSKLSLQKELSLIWKKEPLDQPLYLEITFNFIKPVSVRREWPSVKPDIDNLSKLVLDSFNKKLWRDDSLIVGLMLMKTYKEVSGIDMNVYLL